jgi:3-isopropylmalate dehydrogenase
VLKQGFPTADIYSEGTIRASTKEMGDAVVKGLG